MIVKHNLFYLDIFNSNLDVFFVLVFCNKLKKYQSGPKYTN